MYTVDGVTGLEAFTYTKLIESYRCIVHLHKLADESG